MGRERPGDGDALLLAAGELVRVAVAGARVDADRRQHLGDSLARGSRGRRGRRAVRATMSATVMRGSSELSGSWNTICTSRRNHRSSCGRPGSTGRPAIRHGALVARSRPSRMRASVDLPEPDSPTMPSVSPARDVEADAGERLALGPRPEHAGARQAVDAVDRRRRASSDVAHVADRRLAICSSGGRAVLRAAASSSTVYGCCGAPMTLAAVPVSTIAPRRITRTSSATVGHEGDVVGDEQQRRVLLGDQLGEQGEHAGLHRDVEGRRRLVGDEQRRAAGQGHGDADALALPARQLVRVGPHRARRVRAGRRARTARSAASAAADLDMPEWRRSGSAICLPTRISGLSAVCGFWNTIAICSPRSLDSSLSRRPTSCCAVETDAAGHRRRVRGQADDGQRRQRLARARLADDRQPLAAARW